MAEKQKQTVKKRRRKAPIWDRIKIVVLILTILGFTAASIYNPPFVGFVDTLSELWNRNIARLLLIALPLELLRQIHYYVAERSAGYNTFWSDSFFGGIERQSHRRLSPWTRFRLGRYLRWTFLLLLFGVILDFFVDEVNSPIEALAQSPRIIADSIGQIIFFVFYMFIIVGQFALIFWFLSRGGVDVVLPEEIETRYTDVWGQDHVLELVKENVGFLEKPDEIEEKGGYIPGGILLWGPPGTGKTLIAEATAGEVGVPFVFIEPGAFINMFMGVGILKVKGLFRKLRKLSLRHGGVVAFFDEADALGNRGALASGGVGQPMTDLGLNPSCNGFHYLSSVSRRHVLDDRAAASDLSVADEQPGTTVDKVIMGGMGGGGGMGTLQALLTEISGLTKPRGFFNRMRKALGMKPKLPPKYRIFIMMASNMPEALDQALLRPGRIDRLYRVGYPSLEGRRATLDGYFAKVEHELSDDELHDLAVKTPFYSGAKIKDLVNEALILAMRDDRQVITLEDVRKAKRLKELGPPEDTEYIERERHAIAVHEACHAVVGHLTKTHREIDIATIERHSQALGLVSSIAMEDRVTQWRTEFEADIMTSVASLVGEKMFFGGDNSSGVSADLNNATRLAAYMQGVFGMGDSISSLAVLSAGRFGTPDPTPDIIKKQGKQVESILSHLFDETETLLEEYSDKVLAVAAALEDRKTITGEDIAEIIGVPAGSYVLDAEGSWSYVDPNRAQIAVGNVSPNGDTSANGEVSGDSNPNGATGAATADSDADDTQSDERAADEEAEPTEAS